jgi:hypothetical protein
VPLTARPVVLRLPVDGVMESDHDVVALRADDLADTSLIDSAVSPP